MDERFSEEKKMKRKHRSKFLFESGYVAEVDIELIEAHDEWSPYLSIEDAYKLDDVREALRRGDLQAAMKKSRVFTLTPVMPETTLGNKELR
jgi:hypothetical protein